jgi:plastocyanin
LFKKLLVASVVVVIAAAFVACGGGDDEDDDSPGPSGGGNSAAIDVRMLDFAYESTGVRGVAGQQTTLNLKNDGAQPHTFTITGLVDSGTVAPGQSKTISFTPTQAGTLTFFCAIHSQAVMSGRMTVN